MQQHPCVLVTPSALWSVLLAGRFHSARGFPSTTLILRSATLAAAASTSRRRNHEPKTTKFLGARGPAGTHGFVPPGSSANLSKGSGRAFFGPPRPRMHDLTASLLARISNGPHANPCLSQSVL